MTGAIINIEITPAVKHIILDTRDCFTCSFTEFFPSCTQLYYFSNFKDFNRLAQA